VLIAAGALFLVAASIAVASRIGEEESTLILAEAPNVAKPVMGGRT